MSARVLLQAALVEALSASPALAGVAVFDAPPSRAPVPHCLVEEPLLADWSSKTWRGVEGRFAMTIVDAGERPARLRGFADAAEEAALALPDTLGEGWRVASLVFVRSRLSRGSGDRWSASVEFQVRLWRES